MISWRKLCEDEVLYKVFFRGVERSIFTLCHEDVSIFFIMAETDEQTPLTILVMKNEIKIMKMNGNYMHEFEKIINTSSDVENDCLNFYKSKS